LSGSKAKDLDILCYCEHYVFNIRYGSEQNMSYLHNKLELIRKMPGAYIGATNLSLLQQNMYGYIDALEEFNIEERSKSLFPLPLRYLNEYVANWYNYSNTPSGWRNIILEHNNLDEEKSFFEFYKLYDAFIALSSKSCDKAILSKENIEYHYTDKNVPRIVINSFKTEPLYKNPIVIYLIELSDNSGYLLVVITEEETILEHEIYKNKRRVMLYIESCFGKILKWENGQIDSLEINSKLY